MKKQTSMWMRLLTALLACFLTFSLFVACDKEGEGDESNTVDSGTDSESVTTAPDTSVVDVVLFENDAYTATVVYADGVDASMRGKLNTALRNRVYKSPSMKKDSEVEDNGGFEILIGTTNRAQSALPTDLGENDVWYCVRFVDKKLVINGSNETMLTMAMDLFVNTYISNSTDETRITLPGNIDQNIMLRDFTSEKWDLESIPAYVGENIVCSSPYDCGPLLTDMINTAGDTQMVLVSGTTREEFTSYVTRLTSFGYEIEEQSTIEKNEYVTLYNGTQRVHTYFTNAKNTVNVIVDPVSVSVDEFSYTVEAKENEGATFYLYGLAMDPGGYNPSGKADSYLNTTGLPNCGALLVIKLADNSVVIVDGGNGTQMKAVAGDYQYLNEFDAFLHEITGKSENEKITIAAWFLSHTHGDHTGGFKTFLDRCASKYELERVFMNIAGSDIVSSSESGVLSSISAIIKRNYPNCKEIKLHTGQSVQLADVTFQVLYTHEDNVNKITGKTQIKDTNDSCTVVRVSTEGMSMFMWGDANTTTESIITRAFTTTTLKSDIVQVAHHGFNKLNAGLKAINAPIAFFCQAEGGMHKNSSQQAIFDIIAKYSTIHYFQGNFSTTTGLAYRDGEIKVVYSGASS